MSEVVKKSNRSFFKNLGTEFKKIIFPKKETVRKQVLLIVVSIIILGVLISLLDSGIGYLVSLAS